ncbi:unnamed protein product [Cuscuta epithymum]|uniref:HTH myb-type domain-containing protein n=1 Tax=Cuscuta epithymum TaxID=186058 RepID=A0AAV0CG42_9ASTE|nr:unnamed protein product [Cuscuta epithymum]
MVFNHDDSKARRCREYVDALEDERRKIEVFRRELPLCLQLVTQAIEAYKQQLSGRTASEFYLNGESESSEPLSSGGPIFEEFIPIKKRTEEDENEMEDTKLQSRELNTDNDDNNNNSFDNKGEFSVSSNNNSNKSDWLRSAHLWSPSPYPTPKQESVGKAALTEVNRNGSGGAFHPFQRDRSGVATEVKLDTAAAASSTSGTRVRNGGGSKQRRCWSPELHRRFLQALQQIGGSHVATPKQIRELMKVDGLTNDEVKSHLQKYRLHTRRPSTMSTHNNNHQQQAPQFLVVGGVWVPPSKQAGTGADSVEAATSNGIYAPNASQLVASQNPSTSFKMSCSQERCSQSKDQAPSNSPATSSSTHTTTASTAY